MLSEEGNVNEVTDADTSNDADGSNSPGGNAVFRVRNVAEINGNNGNSIREGSLKRKIVECAPSQLEIDDSEDGVTTSGSPKKRKPSESDAGTSGCTSEAGQSAQGPREGNGGLENSASSSSTQSQIKEEPVNVGTSMIEAASRTASNEPEPMQNETEETVSAAPSSAGPQEINGISTTTKTTEVKTEPAIDDIDDPQPSSSGVVNPNDVKPPVKVEKADASSTTSRASCKYGILCYRRNPMHRQEEAHPGDSDYKRPNYPLPPKGTPDCPFGNSCYRRNPLHFQQYTHPPDN